MSRTGKQVFSDGMKLLINDIRSIKWALILISVCFAFFEIIGHSICPVYALTGYPCPGCGLTRAGLRALHLDFAGAWKMNPFIFPVGALSAAYAANRYIFGSGNQRSSGGVLRVSLSPKRRKRRKWLDFCAALVLAGLIVFYIWRMVERFPSEPPMVYNGQNLAMRLCRIAGRS